MIRLLQKQKTPIYFNFRSKSEPCSELPIGSSCYLPFVCQLLHITRSKAGSISCRRRKAILLTWTIDAAASALCFLPSHGVTPTMAVFRPHSLRCNAVLRFLQATLETSSSSQFRASRSIALSLQTIRREITCIYNSSLANILNCQNSAILRICWHSCDALPAHTQHDGFGFIKFCKFTKS